MAQVRHVSDGDRLDAVLQQARPALCIVDLRVTKSRDLLEQIQKDWPDILLVALGTVRSEPFREAEQSGIYAAEDLQVDRQRFQALIARAFDYLKVLQENRDLHEARSTITLAPAPRVEPIAERGGASSIRLLRFPRVFRRFENVGSLLENVVESIADAAGVTRVGIFSKIRQGDRYRLRAGLRCIPETHEMEFGERDALVRWFELQAHLISRAGLAQIAEQGERTLLRRALDTFGAEVIVPLYARGRIIGWIFFGHRLTGQPFDYADLESLMLLAEHVSTVLENALLHEETTLQKTLAETLLKSIPPGIVAMDEEGVIRWFNPTAEQILGLPAEKVLNKPAEAVGGTLAAFLRDALDSTANLPARQWTDNNTRRSIFVETRRLLDGDTPLGVVAVVQDLTTEERLREKQDLLDRTAFWTDLARNSQPAGRHKDLRPTPAGAIR
jgi:PAS domain S-box-containing protein